MINRKVKSFFDKRRSTLLGIGPMSKNCVDATIETANEYEIPLMLIASRRQIDAEFLGGGYVNNWSTETFSDYVIENDKKGYIILARDHGGPWQNDKEKNNQLSFRLAMESAKRSFEVDIINGFEIIHLDPSIDVFKTPSVEDVLERVFELYEFCWSVAKRNNKQIAFEIGTEEQTGSINSTEEIEFVLKKLFDFCDKNSFIRPIFLVTQTGTSVKETRNVGTFDSPFRIAHELPSEILVPKIIELCNQNQIFMKVHNTDYLSEESLEWYPKIGIHAANVAPEFGVTETRSFLSLLEKYHLSDEYNQFIDLAFQSEQWKKWMLLDTKASRIDKAIIAGHYTFSSDKFRTIKASAQDKLSDINIDFVLKEQIKKLILKYVKLFRLVRL